MIRIYVFAIMAFSGVLLDAQEGKYEKEVGITSSIENSSPLNPNDTFSNMIFKLVHNGDTRRALELTDEQAVELDSVFNERPGQFQERLSAISKERGPENASVEIRRRLGKEVTEIMQGEAVAQVGNILLPHQIQILEESAVREVRSRAGVKGLFSTRWLRKRLEIDDEQFERLKERAAKEAAAFEKEVRKLEEQAEENVLKELSSKQRKMLKQLLGDEQR